MKHGSNTDRCAPRAFIRGWMNAEPNCEAPALLSVIDPCFIRGFACFPICQESTSQTPISRYK